MPATTNPYGGSSTASPMVDRIQRTFWLFPSARERRHAASHRSPRFASHVRSWVEPTNIEAPLFTLTSYRVMDADAPRPVMQSRISEARRFR
jgi:hypothetical protein